MRLEFIHKDKFKNPVYDNYYNNPDHPNSAFFPRNNRISSVTLAKVI